jgi:hypothetical protein
MFMGVPQLFIKRVLMLQRAIALHRTPFGAIAPGSANTSYRGTSSF